MIDILNTNLGEIKIGNVVSVVLIVVGVKLMTVAYKNGKRSIKRNQ